MTGIFPPARPQHRLRWHSAELVAASAAVRGLRHLSLTGNRWLIGSEIYPDKFSARRLA